MATLVTSGSSLNIPSGSGTERVRRAVLQGNTGTNTLLAGVAGHLYTVISIICAEQQNLAGTFYIMINNGTNTTSIISSQAIGAMEVFVFNDKFVMEEDDILTVNNSTTDNDWYISYIDQDWT
jgi:hypothetical protein